MKNKEHRHLGNILDQEESSALVEIRNLQKSFGDNHVLRGFNLDLFPNENVVIVGKSGSGKSVLIKCLIGLVDVDEGTIKVLGKSIPDLRQEELDQIRTEVGFLFQGSALYDSMTVRENLLFPLRRHPERMKDQNEDDLILNALKSVGLESAIDLMPAELSGGMKRRIALARTLILQPKIILYDEPTSGLDPITANEIVQLILKIQEEFDTASIIITHDMDCARVISNRMIILQDGINYAEGLYSELSKSNDPKIKAFFKEIQNRKMSREKINTVKLGLFVTLAVVLFITAVYYIGNKQNLFGSTFTISADFQNINGLTPGNNVRYSGINVGIVKKINLVNDSMIRVDMAIQKEVQANIKKNAVASIGSDGLVGNMIININPGDGNQQMVQEGDVILSYARAEAADMLSSLGNTAENIALLTVNLLEIAENINSGQGSAAKFINDAEMANNLQETIRQLRIASQNMNNFSSDLKGTVDDLNEGEGLLGYLLKDSTFEYRMANITDGLDSLVNRRTIPIMDNLEQSSQDIASTSAELKELMEKINVEEGILGVMLKDSVSAEHIKKTIENLDEGTDRFNENMEALKHNFFFRKYFKKQEKKRKKELEKQEKENAGSSANN